MEIISIGAIITNNNGVILNRFNSYIKPLKYPTMGRYYTRLTKITQKNIDNASLFPIVINDFCKLISQYNIVNFFVFGSEDKMILKKEIKRHNYNGPFNKIYKQIINIQPEISKTIKYKKEIIRIQWGLFDLIKLYSIKKYTKQDHNALTDALMLKDVYFAYISQKKPNNEFLKEVWLDKKEKEHKLLLEKKENIDIYLKSKLQIHITELNSSNFYGATKDFLLFLGYALEDIAKIRKSTEIKIIFNHNNKEIKIYYFIKNEIKLLTCIDVNVDNFKKVKRYINFLKRHNNYILL